MSHGGSQGSVSTPRLARPAPPPAIDQGLGPGPPRETTRTPPRQVRPHRPRVRRTTTFETRAPSIGLAIASQRWWARTRSFLHLHASPRTRSPATSRPRPAKGREGRFRLPRSVPPHRGASAAARRPVDGEDASPRCLQPISDTSTLRVARLPLCHVIRAACAAFIMTACAADVKDRAERRLTATLRLRADGVRPPPRPPGGEAMVMIGRCSVLVGAAIDSPSGSAPRRRLDSATRRGCDPTSDALCRDRDPRPALARRPSTPAKAETPANATHTGLSPTEWDTTARSASTALASTRATSTNQDVFHRRVLPAVPGSPCSHRVRGGSPPPYPRLRRRGPASGAPSPLLTKRLDPLASTSPRGRKRTARASAARRLLQSCQPASTTARSPDPRTRHAPQACVTA